MDIKQLIVEAKKLGLDISHLVPKESRFHAIVRYNRGLGAEYLSLPPFNAANPAEAQMQAETQAAEHFKKEKKVVIEEVKIRPTV